MNPEFLDVDDVLEVHAGQVAEHGGSDRLRDRALLESAVAQPMAAFDGQFLNEDPFAMAAVLLLSLVKNHPFVDGNKRTGLLAALVFLDLNGFPIGSPTDLLDALTLEAASDGLDKPEIARRLRDLAITWTGKGPAA
ncbi:MAG: type II toxin-antitoxin system death-on-curing family toxin [Isosphaeraceae bacterium]